MKIVRGIYGWAFYIIGAPLILLFSIVFLTWMIIKGIIEYGFELDDVVGGIKAYFEGMKIAHKQNMQWIKHGGQFILLQDDEEV